MKIYFTTNNLVRCGGQKQICRTWKIKPCCRNIHKASTAKQAYDLNNIKCNRTADETFALLKNEKEVDNCDVKSSDAPLHDHISSYVVNESLLQEHSTVFIIL